MITIALEPYWEKLHSYHKDHVQDKEFWDWLKDEYNGYQVYVVTDPSRTEPAKAYGLMFGDDAEGTFFTLKWS